MRERDIATLATCSLFRAVPIERFATLLTAVRYQDHQYPKGSLILLQGCIYTSLFILLEGSAFAEMSDDEGRCMRVETFAPVQALASAVLFAPQPILPVTVGAQSDCHVIAIPKIELLKLCMSDTTILEALLSESGSRIQFLSERLRLTQFATLRQRIADWLLRKVQATARISPQQELRVKAEPTFEKIADLMGVARPSLSRELSRMKKEGLLDIEGKTIEIKNLEALKQIRHSKTRLR